jgi:hypothetical protein
VTFQFFSRAALNGICVAPHLSIYIWTLAASWRAVVILVETFVDESGTMARPARVRSKRRSVRRLSIIAAERWCFCSDGSWQLIR